MKNKILSAVLIASCAAPLFAQSPEALRSSVEQAFSGLSGFKADRQAQVPAIKGVPATVPAATEQKNRYAHIANIKVQSRELVSRQGNMALLKFKASLLVRNFSGMVIADGVEVEFQYEVPVSAKGVVSSYIVPQLYGVKLYIGDRLIGVGDFDKGSVLVSGKVTDKKVRVTGVSRTWGWVELLNQ
jgi:hypothetical protein